MNQLNIRFSAIHRCPSSPLDSVLWTRLDCPIDSDKFLTSKSAFQISVFKFCLPPDRRWQFDTSEVWELANDHHTAFWTLQI